MHRSSVVFAGAESISAPKRGQRTKVARQLLILVRFQTHSTLAFILAVSLLPACRPCARVENEYSNRLRDELAMVGSGLTVDTGLTDHVRVTLTDSAFQYAAASLGEVEVFRPAARQITVRIPGSRTIVVEGELVARLISVQAVAADDGRVILMTVDSIVSYEIDGLERRSSFIATTARTTIRAPLAFLPVDGTALLAVDMADAQLAELGLEGVELESAIPADLAESLATSLMEEVIENAPEFLPVLTFPRIDLAWSTLEVAPSSLLVDSETGAITMGLVTPLRPRGRMAASAPPSEDGFVMDLHPDLWQSAMTHLQAVGRMPRRFNEEGDPTITGTIGVGVDWAIASRNRMELKSTSWCFGVTRCRVESHVADGRFGAVNGQVTVSFAGRAETPESWEPSMLAAARDTAASLLNPTPLRLEAGSQLNLQVERASASPSGIRLEGTVDSRPAEVL
ncbi:MAG: hypothetical protein ACJAYU_003517 [Bradymonadia bacterium]|jgi:hypothetical protein